MSQSENQQFPPQRQENQPGIEREMQPRPVYERENYEGCGKLKDKVALITGGDSGIGRAVAIAYAKEGADICILYLKEHEDARETKRKIEEKGRKCLILSGDVANEKFCNSAVENTIEEFGRLDILVNNAGEQHPQESIEKITCEQLERTFKTNIFSMFCLVKAALKYLKEGSCIINTASITAYLGSPALLDYSSAKGAVVSFTRSLALNLADRKIRVNGVAPGLIWTPLIPSTFPEEKTSSFEKNIPMKRAGQPVEVAPSYVFLASEDSFYISGQILHPNGGDIVNG